MADVDPNAMTESLESAFGDAPVAPKPPVDAPSPEEETPTEEGAAAPVREGEEAPAEVEEPAEGEDKAAVSEPAIEVEVDGVRETIRGEAKIREFVQKGLHYTRGSEEIARTREALKAQKDFMIEAQKFQLEAMKDIAALQNMDSQLEEWKKVDWNLAFDTDHLNALKMKEQRDRLRDDRQSLFQKVQGSVGEFQQRQTKAAQELLAAEEAALVAKLPEWRNSERGRTEVAAIKQYLLTKGYTPAEITIVPDHRMMLLAREAYLYNQLQQGKSQKLGQARNAPPVVRPGVASQQQNGKADFAKFQKTFRRSGQEGNHRAQEAELTKLLSKTFKVR